MISQEALARLVALTSMMAPASTSKARRPFSDELPDERALERFLANVAKQGPDECWPWKGSRLRAGYGRISINRRYVSAHRIALALVKGPPPSPELQACHTCDNPPCCNPAHLWWGTNAENMDDAAKKGRKISGTPPKIDATECMILHNQGWSYSRLAKRYDVNQASVGKMLARVRTRAATLATPIAGER